MDSSVICMQINNTYEVIRKKEERRVISQQSIEIH